MRTEIEISEELLRRIIRIESRMVQLGDFVGANLRSKERIDVLSMPTGTAVEIDALDVSLSRIITELAHAEAKGIVITPGPIPVYHMHKIVMTVFRK